MHQFGCVCHKESVYTCTVKTDSSVDTQQYPNAQVVNVLVISRIHTIYCFEVSYCIYQWVWSSAFWHSNLWLTISMFRSLWWMRNATNMQSLYMSVILLNAAFMPLSRFSVRTSGCPLSVAVACCPTTGSSGDVGVALQNDSPWSLREASSGLKDWNYCEVGSWSEPTTLFHLKNLQNNLQWLTDVNVALLYNRHNRNKHR